MRISKRFVQFNAKFDNFLSYVRANDVRLGLGASLYSPLVDVWLEWEIAFAAYTGADSGNSIITHQIQNLHKDANEKIVVIQQYLKHRPNVTYRPADYVNLGIHIDKKTYTRVPPPTLSPTNVLVDSHHLVNRIKVFNAKNNDYKSHKKPVGVQAIGRKIAIVPISQADTSPPSPHEYRLLPPSGRALFNLVFTTEDFGQLGYLITWYLNRRGEMGPESMPLLFQII